MSTPESNVYTLPYKSQLQEKIEPGQTLIIRGSSIPESVRFTISLHCKTPDYSGNDIPLHISVRFDEAKPVPYESGFANGLPVGKKLIIHGTPEKKAKHFLVNLLHKNGDIALHFNPRLDEKITINDVSFCKFAHRSDPHDISGLQIDGEIELTGIQLH